MGVEAAQMEREPGVCLKPEQGPCRAPGGLRGKRRGQVSASGRGGRDPGSEVPLSSSDPRTAARDAQAWELLCRAQEVLLPGLS